MDDDFVNIDREKLDQEWVKQPRLALTVGEAEMEAAYELDQCKVRLDFVESELYLAIRNTPSEFNLQDKPSEATIKAAITTHIRYQEALQNVNEARYKSKMYSVRTSAVEHKKRALEKLVDLEWMHYNSEPKASSINGREFAEQAAKKEFYKATKIKPKKAKPIKRRKPQKRKLHSVS